ncbi:MAG: hypothetical protein OM95_16805 [Bdellovibrio sp. ArHS]|uniref:hypothetical protein n=1 Tax=Bdellovibrio sp. ArHS TaxID=1569284 RepID=UPI0005829099|nr:hypothetical protein [Bdellovibrio sp. ArHS]KHD87008.1 MAG: hypothetical protein OM95_16805 [Bdellovibrio sp. ArHS]
MFMNFKYLLVLFSLATMPLSSFAAVFGPPFHFKDGQSHERKDIKKKIKSFRVQTSRNPLPPLVYVDTSDVKLVMFTEIAEILERATQPHWTPVSSAYAKNCPTHILKSQMPMPVVNSLEPRCESLDQRLRAYLSEPVLRGCRQTYQPESFVESRGPGAVSENDLQSLEGLLAVPLEALRKVNLPTNLLSQEDQNQLREIIVKVRAEAIKYHIDSERRALTELLASLQNSEECYGEEAKASLYATFYQLYKEVTDAGVYIQDLEARGLSQAMADRQRVLQSGRQRSSLPFPTLTDKNRQFISMYLGGVYWRMRGGGLVSEPQGTQKTRYWYNYLPMKMIGYINGGSDGEIAGELMFLQIFQGWGEWMDMGRTAGGKDAYYDLTYMTDRGVDQVNPLMMALALKGYETADLSIGGMQMGACYYFAWDRLPRFTLGADLTAPYAGFIDGPTAVGELCTGASISLGLSKTLLNGK